MWAVSGLNCPHGIELVACAFSCHLHIWDVESASSGVNMWPDTKTYEERQGLSKHRVCDFDTLQGLKMILAGK